MPGITLAQAQAQLDGWLAASTAVSGNQSYSIEGRTLTRADAAEIRRMIQYWESKVQTLEASAQGRGRTRYVVPK